MKKSRNFSFGFVTFLIVYFIFMTMNELIAQLIFYLGLTIIGLYIFRTLNLIFEKLYGIIKDVRFIDCGFWNRDEIYNWDIKLVNFRKEGVSNEESKR